jgi:hypothetical protein
LWYLALLGAGLLALTLALHWVTPYTNGMSLFIRGTAVLGYLTLFLAIVSSQYMRALVRFFGASFIKIHHIATGAGLALVTLHAIGIAVRAGSLSVFIPDTSSLRNFLLFGGRPALYLLFLAALAAILRRSLSRVWRQAHWLTYLAFLLATAHAILLAVGFGPLGMQALAILLAVAVVGVFALKRRSKAGAKSR